MRIVWKSAFGALCIASLVAVGVTTRSGEARAASDPSWAPLLEPHTGGHVVAASYQPGNSSHMLVGGDMLGIGVSDDGGRSWQPTTGLSSYEIGQFTWAGSTVWVGTYGGPARSVDGGRTWTMSSGWPRSTTYADATSANRRVEAVLVNPANNEVFAFCGSQRHFDGDPPSDGQLYVSGDGGNTWALRARITPAATASTPAITINAAAPLAGWATLLVAADDGVYRSTNAGLTWTKTRTGVTRDLAVHPTNSLRAWVAGDGGVFATSDGGLTWQAATGLPATNYDIVAVAPSNPTILWTTYGFDSAGSHGLYRSLDGGASWTSIDIGTRGFQSPYVSGGDMVGDIAISPDDANRLIGVNQEDLIITEDGGTSFFSGTAKRATDGRWSGRGYGGVLGDGVAFSETTSGMISLTGLDGANPFVSTDGGVGWLRPAAAVAHDPWFGAVGADYGPDDTLWALRGNFYFGFNGIFRGASGGAGAGTVITAARGLPSVDRFKYPGATSIVAINGGAVASIGGRLYRSTNNGSTWAMSTACPGAGSLVREYRSWTTLYVGCNDGVRRSTDGGNRWTQLPGSPAAGGADNRLSSTRNGVIVSHRYFNDLQLYRNGAFTTVRVPNAPGVAQAVFDGGTTNPTRIMAVTYAPSATGQTGAIGALVSDDAGSTWRQVNGGLGMLRFFSVNADPHHAGVFIAGTYGGGFYRINLNAPLTGAIVQPDPKAPQGRVPDVVDQRPGNRGRRPELPPQALVPELPRQAQAPGN